MRLGCVNKVPRSEKLPPHNPIIVFCQGFVDVSACEVPAACLPLLVKKKNPILAAFLPSFLRSFRARPSARSGSQAPAR